MNRWWGYVVRIAGTDEQKAIADHSGIGSTVVSRWFNGKNEPSAKLVIAFARAYNRPPVEALVAAGYLTESEATEVIEVHRGLGALTDDELLAEVKSRMKRGQASADDGEPADPNPGLDRWRSDAGQVEDSDDSADETG